MDAHAPAATIREEVVPVWTDGLAIHVKIAGSGPPLLFAHSAGGPRWTPFNDWLAETHTVYAPELPGTSAGEPRAIDKVETFADLVLAYEELVRALGIAGAVAVGESLGGMIVADLAAHFPALFSKVVLLSPAGLWLDEQPPRVVELISAPPEQAPEYLFYDSEGQIAKDFFRLPDDPELEPQVIAAAVWAQGCASKFLWPIPDQGLAKRLHRVAAPTLIVFGREDRVIPSAYGQQFADRIASSRLELIDRCGHIPHVESPERTRELVGGFLDG
jgi:pimeloyl-ACP methyl ester carboxylesterase